MSHKDVWNTIVHSSQMFEWGHPLHDLDKMVLWVVGFVFVICLAAIVEMERKFCRDSRESRHEYSRWLREWRKQQKKER